MATDVHPTTPDDFARPIQSHFSANDGAEQALPIPRAYRHQIGARLGIIMPFHAYRSAVVSVSVVFQRVICYLNEEPVPYPLNCST